MAGLAAIKSADREDETDIVGDENIKEASDAIQSGNYAAIVHTRGGLITARRK